ncbi:methyl-accepting chemotaxis sensory transducer with Cache sensor [Mobilisporobacter senegalensis]|uniref:Methyl-accepting chemotaxis sensory transducer with Cache sensor n=1 Tax=Mobilisporobacter senegalensis TaxID=1329262 RepID=A0A3N1XY15_9FIRM|nr:methyl-accepting chemotaxis protein [Mobilisporobacter senegalensis]ROR31506.1 methyl-accepting chemotaxis sensory transducer with Cache sensor [Mobilisporobacter senegalensis]
MKKSRTNDNEKTKRGSIKAKLIFIVIPIMIISIVTLLTITFQAAKKIIVGYGNQTIESVSLANANQIETWSQDILSFLNSVKNTLDTVAFNEDTQMSYLISTMDQNDNFPDGVYIGTDNLEFINPFNYIPPDDFVVTERDWYIRGLKNDSFAYGPSYIDVITNKPVVSASAKIKPVNGVNRVAAVDISLEEISNMVKEMKVMKTGTAFLVDTSTNTIIAHQDPDLMNMEINENSEDIFLAEVVKHMNAKDYNAFHVKQNKDTYIVDLEMVENSNWVLVSTVPQAEVLGSLQELQLLVIILAIVSILLVMVIIERVIHVIIHPIKKLTVAITEITKGDFTVNVTAKGNDEIAVMSRRMQKFIETMRGILKEIGSMSDKLSGQAENSSKVAENLYNSAQNQSSSMGELNSTVDELARSVSEIAENATTLAMVVSETGVKGKEASGKMNETVNVSEQGRKDMEQINLAMEEVKDTVSSLVKSVEEVGESTGKINDIVTLIGEIAEETNLLSLNAAIEAARAGEAGKGFAVVAEEIRKLAENSENSVKNISELTNNISRLVNNTVDKTKESADSIKKSMTLIDTASETFGTIYSTVSETSTIVQDMIEKVQHVDNVATSVAAITEEQSAGAEEILATSESLSEQATQVTSNSETVGKDAMELAETAENLDKQIKTFKI